MTSWYILQTLIAMAAALPVYLIVRVALLALRRKKQPRNWPRELALCFFSLCLVGLFSQTLLVEGYMLERGQARAVWWSQFNLVPFRIFADSVEQIRRVNNYGYFIVNFFGNIAMFLPIGLFLPMLCPKCSFGKTLLIGLGISLLIELCQIPLGRGTDIDDLWLNTLGAALGYALFLLALRIWPKLAHCCHAKAPEKQEK